MHTRAVLKFSQLPVLAQSSASDCVFSKCDELFARPWTDKHLEHNSCLVPDISQFPPSLPFLSLLLSLYYIG